MAERRTEDGAARPAAGPSAPTTEFDAFVSYDRTTDAALAAKLQGRLEQRDERPDRHSELRIRLGDAGSENGALSGLTKRAIERSSHLILLASPASARSPIVRRELEYWRATHGEDPARVLIARTGGDIVWDHLYDNLDPYATTALACAPAMGVSTTHDPFYGFFEEPPRVVPVSKPGITPASRAEFSARCRELVAPIPPRQAKAEDVSAVADKEPLAAKPLAPEPKAPPAVRPAAEKSVTPERRAAVRPSTEFKPPAKAKPGPVAKPQPATKPPAAVKVPPKTSAAADDWPSLGLFGGRGLLVPSLAALVGLTALGLIVFLGVRTGDGDNSDDPVALSSSTSTTETPDRTASTATSQPTTTSGPTTSRPSTTAASAPTVRPTTTVDSDGLRPAPVNPRPRPSGATSSSAVPGAGVATTSRATVTSRPAPTTSIRQETGTRPVATTPSPRTAAPTTRRPPTVVPAPTTAAPTTAVPTTAVPTTAVPTTAVPTTVVPTTATPATTQRPTTTVRPTTTTQRPITTVRRTTTTRLPTTTVRQTTTTRRVTTTSPPATVAPTTTTTVLAPPPPTAPPVVTAPPTTVARPTPGSSTTTTARAVLIPLGQGSGSAPSVGTDSLIPIPDTFPSTSSPLQPAPTSNGGTTPSSTSSACIALVPGTPNPPVCLE